MASNDAPVTRIEVGSREGQWVALGRRGWVYWHHPDVSADVRIRLERGADSTWKVASIWIDSSEGVPSNVLRLLTFGPIESIGSDRVLSRLIGADGPELPELDPARCPPGKALERALAMPLRKAETMLVIPIPPPDQRTDLWWDIFAAVYSAAAQQTRSPAKAIAEANGIAVTKVHALWREAKRRQQTRMTEWREEKRLDEPRQARLDRGLAILGVDWDEYVDRFGGDGRADPLRVWDEDGDIVGPPADFDFSTLEPIERPA